MDTGLTAFSESSIEQIKRDLFTLQQYLDASTRWTFIFAFGAKSQAAQVLKKFALPRTPADATRLKKHLELLEARLVLSQLMGEVKLAADDRIEQYLHAAGQWLPQLERIATDPALKGIAPILARLFTATAFADPQTQDTATPTSDFLDGLVLSVARADAIVRLEDEFTAAGLFDSNWLTIFSAGLRNGKPARETVGRLLKSSINWKRFFASAHCGPLCRCHSSQPPTRSSGS